MGLEDIKRIIGSHVLFERKKKKWDQKTLANHSGVALKTIYQIENFKANPTLKTIEKLAKSFGKEIEDFLK